MTQLQEIVNKVTRIAGGEEVLLRPPVCVKGESFAAWAVCVGPNGRLAVADFECEWHEVGEQDRKLITQLHERLCIYSDEKIAELDAQWLEDTTGGF